MCFAPQWRALFPASECQKVVRICQFFTPLTWKCPSWHTGVHFFGISTSKSGPNLVCFVHFDLEMCFAPQECALYRHLNFQKVVWEWCGSYILTWKCASRHKTLHFIDISTSKKWSGNGVARTFWLGNVLRATTAWTFSTSQLLKVLWSTGALYILTWKFASGHNGVQFFISHLARWLRTRRFSEPTFRPPGAPNHWKNTVNRDFPTFSRTGIFFLLTLSLLCSSHFWASPLWLLPPLLFHVSILSGVWLLNFLRLDYLRDSLTPTLCAMPCHGSDVACAVPFGLRKPRESALGLPGVSKKGGGLRLD